MGLTEFGILNTNCWQETKLTPKIRTFINTDFPQIIHIIKTGWEKPQMYSVVIEDGENGYPKLEFLNGEEIKENYNIKIN